MQSLHRALAVLATVLSAASGALVGSAPSREGYMLQTLPSVKGAWLLNTWCRAALDVRAQGFQPETEAIGERAEKMKQLSAELPSLMAQAKLLGLCEQGTMSYSTLPEPHAAIGERLSRTKLVAALSAGKGSALAFVSTWEDHVCIDNCVVNPNYLQLGEEAEAVLLDYVADEALADGAAEARLLTRSLEMPTTPDAHDLAT